MADITPFRPSCLGYTVEKEGLGMHFRTNGGRSTAILFDDVVNSMYDLQARAVIKQWIEERKLDVSLVTMEKKL